VNGALTSYTHDLLGRLETATRSGQWSQMFEYRRVREPRLLRDNSACFEMFGTEETRRNAWCPDALLGKLFFNQGGLGSIGYGPTLGAIALTSPTIAGGSVGVRINISQASWIQNAGDERDHALTLLHELGHAFNLLIVRRPGGNTIK
jgi:hypothetical protein